MATGEHAVQGMSEFVEKSLHFVDGKQRGSIGGRFGEVCHVVNDGAYFFTVLYIGFTEVVHPSSGTFPGTGEVIGIEYGHLWFYHDRYKDWLCETSNIPLFINLKGYYPVAKKIEPYVSLSLGYAYNIDEYSGFYCDASIGIRLWKFCVGIGFIHHECTGLTGEDYYNNTFEDELWTRNKFQVKIGFQW